MQQNYKRLAAAVIAVLFVGNVVYESRGMEMPQVKGPHTTLQLRNEESVTVGFDADATRYALKRAIDTQDFVAARRLAMYPAIPRNERNNIILEAMKKWPEAGIFKSTLPLTQQLLWELDSYADYVQLYEVCLRMLEKMKESRLSPLWCDMTEVEILKGLSPETEMGRRVKEDLLREFTITLPV